MASRRYSSAVDLFDRLEQQLSQQLISAERRSPLPPGATGTEAEASASSGEAAENGEKARGPRPAQRLSEFRYGTRSRSFRFPVAITRDQQQAVYREGLLTVTAARANTVSSVTVKVEG